MDIVLFFIILLDDFGVCSLEVEWLPLCCIVIINSVIVCNSKLVC